MKTISKGLQEAFDLIEIYELDEISGADLHDEAIHTCNETRWCEGWSWENFCDNMEDEPETLSAILNGHVRFSKVKAISYGDTVVKLSDEEAEEFLQLQAEIEELDDINITLKEYLNN